MKRRHDLGRLPSRSPMLLAAPLVALAACAPVAQVVTPSVRPTVQVSWTPSPSGSCTVVDGKADPRCTPGATNQQVTQANISSTVCRKGWTATVRPPVSVTEPQKLASMRQYGLTGSPSAFEFDHLIPLELAGAPDDPRNLWSEALEGPRGAHVKDREEDSLHRAVCGGRMTLADAQMAVLRDWRR